jgi:hypothetical protein
MPCLPRLPILALALPLWTQAQFAQASVIDPSGDFLPSYTASAQAPDLDVIAAGVTWNPANQTFSLSAQMAGNLGQTAGAFYVWGLDRGQGTQRFLAGTPSIGAGVFFDSVLILRPDGTGLFNDFINAVVTNLAAGVVQAAGNTIATNPLPLSLFPSTGDQPAAYSWNLWPRVGAGNNNQITDFAPDASNAAVDVPEPGTWAMLGLGLLLRRRGAATPSASGPLRSIPSVD